MQDFSLGIYRIWKEHTDFQTAALKGLLRNVRHVTDEQLLNLHLNYLRSIGAFYVPSGEYLIDMFGKSIQDSTAGVFSGNFCYLIDRVAIPLRHVNGMVPGFVGYSRAPDNEAENELFVKYRYPPAFVYDKSRYFFIEPDELNRALHEKYICIVDGLFDKMTLQALGINAVSLCGSSLTYWHSKYLSLFEKIIVISDNDTAGRKLFTQCKYKHPNCIELQQPFTKDVDDYLKDGQRVAKLIKEFELMRREGFIASHKMKE